LCKTLFDRSKPGVGVEHLLIKSGDSGFDLCAKLRINP
jgi:hypothetical protein